MDSLSLSDNGHIRENAPIEWASAWIESLDVRDRTKEAYGKNVGYYLAWLEMTGHTGAKRSDILAYKDYLKENYGASTVSAYLTPIRAFYSWVSVSFGVPDIAQGIRGSKKPQGFKKDPLTVDQIKTILNDIDTGAPEGLRDYAILSLMTYTGLRVIEVQRADISDIRNIMGRSVLFIQGKGKDEKDNYVILSPKVLQAIQSYIKERGETLDAKAPLFVSGSDRNRGERLTTRSISRIVKQRFVNVGLDSDKLTAHSLRHTAITLALIGGASIQQAQAMARHSNIKTTLIYAHNIERIEAPAEDTISKMLG
jgi:site-specific recombinase XerD